MKKKEIAVKLFKHLIDHNWHGYSQISRWGDGYGTCPIVINGKTYQLQKGDRDCSSAIISAFEASGISCGGATYTGNMRACMTATGNFKWHQMSTGYVAKPGDVYLNEVNHTAMCTSAVPDLLGEFSISETGGIDGAEGDQTGWESHECAYYNYPWDGILECINNETDGTVNNNENTGKKKGETTMVCFYRITDKDKNKVYYFDGEKVHPLNHPDERKVLNDIYKANNGKDIPEFFWTSKAPWYTRLKQAIGRVEK